MSPSTLVFFRSKATWSRVQAPRTLGVVIQVTNTKQKCLNSDWKNITYSAKLKEEPCCSVGF